MTGEQLPRKWSGVSTTVPPFWRWYSGIREWVKHDIRHGCDWVHEGTIFVPGHLPKPTIDPAEMKTIATAKEVDWT